MPPQKKIKKISKLNPEELAQRRLQRRHRRQIRATFAACGFARMDGASDKEFIYQDAKSDFDDIFVLENVIVLAEYTIAKSQNLSAHVKPKKILYDKILENSAKFVEFCKGTFTGGKASLGTKYLPHQFQIKILYCSLNTVSKDIKALVDCVIYMDYGFVRYFSLLVRTIRASSRNELLDFLEIPYSSFGDRSLKKTPSPLTPFLGFVLPETHSNFPPGFKVVSFYTDPQSVLERAYVLRRQGWRSNAGLYQRMIMRPKIDKIRKYLVENERVFVNNIIITLPSGTKILDNNGDTVKISEINETIPAIINIPDDFNSVGLIDGQHRVFSYYEGGPNEAKIATLRSQQNLLATGIIYPDGTTQDERTKFEAELFLEINSNQANARSDLKQAINQIIRPFLADSIARDVLDYMNEHGPLRDQFETHFFDKEKIKTTTIVSYSLRRFVRPSIGGALFSSWTDAARDTFLHAEDDAARLRYIKYCAETINNYLFVVKEILEPKNWTTDTNNAKRLLTPTIIVGLLGAFRLGMEMGIPLADMKTKFEKLKGFDFYKYRSSQYTVMSQDLFKTYLLQ